MTGGNEDEARIDVNSPRDVIDSEENGSDDEDQSESSDLDDEAVEKSRKTVRLQRNQKLAVYSDNEDHDDEADTGPMSLFDFQEPSSSNEPAIGDLPIAVDAAVSDNPTLTESDAALGGRPSLEVDEGLRDVPKYEIPVDGGTALSNTECRALAEGLANGPPETLEVPLAAANIEKRSTGMRRHDQMNGSECGEEVTNEDRALRCNTRGCETVWVCRQLFVMILMLIFASIGGAWFKSTMISCREPGVVPAVWHVSPQSVGVYKPSIFFSEILRNIPK
jgi:hypothetical protein